jgi:ABC-type antimicrobial peptide transport system permease subunit
LKELAPGTSTNLLANDLRTYLDAGLFFKVFVPKGYVDIWREYFSAGTRYFTNSSSFTINGISLTGTQHTHTSFYKTEDFISEDNLSEKIVLFDNPNSKDVSVGTKQVIINVRDFENLYRAEVEEIGKLKLAPQLRILNDISYQSRSAIATAIMGLKSYFDRDLDKTLEKDVLITQQVKGSENISKTTCKIVGVYFGIDAGKADNPNAGIYMPPHGTDYGIHDLYSLMIPTSLMQSFNVYHKQDKYVRMASPSTDNIQSIQSLASIFSEGTGVKVAWYGNTILVSLQQNRAMLKQVTQILLYLSIALASFSVFMLFNYIAVSISSKKRSVGILRALGSKSSDIATIFFTESMIISILNGILACLAAAGGCILINSYIQGVMGLTINFAIYGFRQIFIIMGISLVTGIIASLTPIIKIIRRKPVKLIRKP